MREREINSEGVVGVAGGSAQLAGGHVGVSTLSMQTLRGCGASQLLKERKLPRAKETCYVDMWKEPSCNAGGY